MSAQTERLTWRGTREALEAAEMRLTEIMVPAADAVSLTKENPVENDEESGWTLFAYFETAPDMAAVTAALDGLPLDAPERETLEDRDWVAEALEGLGVVQAGDFLLYGSHDTDKIEGMDGHPLLVEANRAFGTGHHPTTAGCLEALTRLKDNRPQNVLDVGTGSGVLAMAARRLWTEADILGTDIDAPSVAIALENAHTNGIEDIRYVEATGVSAEVAE
ncbi:MAG: 50S ribosomal protein L11 methyltransferase, partial [Pseudomonadota bacterium]